jgi:hypothetical protein
MKLRSIHIILIVILVVAIFIITSSNTVVPYSKDTLFSHMYKYEGMENTNEPGKLPEPLTNADFIAAVDAIKKETEKKDKDGFSITKDFEGPKKVEGFHLQPAPFADSQVLDRYGSTPSGSQCFGNSSGYSKSLGPLCLSKEDARLLSTRGGNITGTDSTIGR